MTNIKQKQERLQSLPLFKPCDKQVWVTWDWERYGIRQWRCIGIAEKYHTGYGLQEQHYFIDAELEEKYVFDDLESALIEYGNLLAKEIKQLKHKLIDLQDLENINTQRLAHERLKALEKISNRKP